MKKIVSLMLVAVMMVASFTSCAFIDELLGKEESGETRYTITEEEWKAMLDMKNYTRESSNTQTIIIDEESETISYTMLEKITEDAEYHKTVNSEISSSEYYYVQKDGITYNVNVWQDGTVSAYEYSSYDWTSSFGTGLVVKFEDLSYDEEKKAYVCSISEEGMTLDYEFYFENGKLVKVIGSGHGNISYGETTATVEVAATMIISNIGTTEVEVPEFTVE